MLHVGHGWLAHRTRDARSQRDSGTAVPSASALHALTVGAVGTMTLAVMTRATLGHIGRELTAGFGTTAIFVLINGAAVARIGAGFAGGGYLFLLALAGVAWIGAFVLFVLFYGPLLLRSRAGS